MSEHTPGPWTVGGSRANSGGFVVRGGKRRGGRIAGVVLSEANARLIAAAPELLEALLMNADRRLNDGTLCWCDECEDPTDEFHEKHCAAARAAVCKATAR